MVTSFGQRKAQKDAYAHYSMQVQETKPSADRANSLAVHSFGESIFALRQQLRLTQSRVAASAGISTSYYSAIENSKRLPPPRATASRLACALQINGDTAETLIAKAMQERSGEQVDASLPTDIRSLIADLRMYAFAIPKKTIKAIRAEIREAVP